MTKICVLGGGSYGTALAFVASKNNNVVIYARDINQVNHINKYHSNLKRFPQVILPNNITATTSLSTAVENSDLIIHAIPCQASYQFINQNKHIFPKGVPYLCTSKGIDATLHNLMIPVIKVALQDRQKDIPLAVLSGPGFAKEIINGCNAGVVVASQDIKICQKIYQIFKNSNLKINITDDLIGVEIGGALKNPLAIGTGIARGLQLGDSTIAFLITMGAKEMRILAAAFGGRPETLSGLSGIGDLMLTCFSKLSRNNQLGEKLALGLTVEQATKELNQAIEGIATCKQVIYFAKQKGIDLERIPFYNTIYKILNGELDCKTGIINLLECGNGQVESFV